MLKKLKQIWYILILLALAMYIPPLIGLREDLAVGAVVYGLCLVSGYFYGMFRGFNIMLPLCVLVMFLPAVCIFYPFEWMYLPVSATIALFGNWLGYRGLCARRDKKNEVEVKNEDYVKSWMVLGDYVPKEKKEPERRD